LPKKKLKIFYVSSLAKALGIEEQRLLKIASNSFSSYSYSFKEKGDGKKRVLSKPPPHLKEVQKKIFKELLAGIDESFAAHGWVGKRSRKTCAEIHIAKKFLYTFDIKTFFDSIRYERVYRLFNRDLGCSPEVARILTRLTTVNYSLPQGSPCSPKIANLILLRFDEEMVAYVKKKGANYSRYGDNILVSADKELKDLGYVIRKALQYENLRVHMDGHKGDERKALGLVVAKKISISKKERNLLRVILNNARETGLSAQNRGKIPNFRLHLMGRIAQIEIFHPQLGRRLMEDLSRVKD
jgi:RNA-directed DNA polymerase